MTERSLSINGLTCGYPKHEVLKELSLPRICAGSVTVMIGPNAAGKTTLLRAIAGLLPARGEVHFDGRNLLALAPAELASLVTYMPQVLPQGVALTTIEAVITALRVAPDRRGDSDTAVHAEAAAVLNRLNIGHLSLTPLDELSGGQRQLVSLAQAIVRRPAVLLLDEPTSALDPRHQIDVMSAVHEIAIEDGMIVMVVLHDLNLALAWADTVVLLVDGKIAAAGPPEEAITSATLEAAYRVRARVERCSQGKLQVIYDGKAV